MLSSRTRSPEKQTDKTSLTSPNTLRSRHTVGWSFVAVITLLISVAVGFVLFAMGLVVHETVIWPTATLAIGIVAALSAALTSSVLIGDGKRALINPVVVRNLVWALLPAAFMVAIPFIDSLARIPPGFWEPLVAVYATTGGVIFASRYRTSEPGSALIKAALWVVGTGAAVIGVIFVASLFGLTGA